jgi:hypothetical protein
MKKNSNKQLLLSSFLQIMLLLSSFLQIPIHVGAFKLVTNLGNDVGAFKFVTNPSTTIVAFKLATNLIVANCDVTLKACYNQPSVQQTQGMEIPSWHHVCKICDHAFETL